jgi:hypothetical protein
MAKKKTDPLKSEGARAERKAMRAYLRRKINAGNLDAASVELENVLAWVLGRMKRYRKKEGGL